MLNATSERWQLADVMLSCCCTDSGLDLHLGRSTLRPCCLTADVAETVGERATTMLQEEALTCVVAAGFSSLLDVSGGAPHARVPDNRRMLTHMRAPDRKRRLGPRTFGVVKIVEK